MWRHLLGGGHGGDNSGSQGNADHYNIQACCVAMIVACVPPRPFICSFMHACALHPMLCNHKQANAVHSVAISQSA